jgi:predicted O-methyltransferase YrrM
VNCAGSGVPSHGVRQTPALVQRAYAAARQIGFPITKQDPGHGRGSACLPGVGQFLAVLAAGCIGGRIAEMGAGAGIGAAWMSGAMPSDCTLLTAEIDPVRAAAAREVLAGDARVQVLTGDAVAQLAPHAPFDLIFADCGVRDGATFATLVSWLNPGGRIVADDLTPVGALPEGSPFKDHDAKRELFAAEERLVWTEVVLPDLANSLLVGTSRY